METHFNIQRRLYDYQFSLTTTLLALEQRHQAFICTYNTTAHQGLLKERFTPPLPLGVLGAAKGRVYTEEELSRRFDHHLFPRRINQYGCVTLHSYYFYLAEGLPHTQVLLWVSGEQLRATFEHVVLAEYRCHYDWRDRQVTGIRERVFYPTRFAPPQGTLLLLTPNDFADVEAIRLRLALYEELSNQSPTPFQWKLDRTQLMTLLAKIEAHRHLLTVAQCHCSEEAA
jgi:hypothetical protein